MLFLTTYMQLGQQYMQMRIPTFASSGVLISNHDKANRKCNLPSIHQGEMDSPLKTTTVSCRPILYQTMNPTSTLSRLRPHKNISFLRTCTVKPTEPHCIVWGHHRLKNPELLHVGNGRSHLIRSFTALAKLSVITHPRIMLLYLVIALADLTVAPCGIQCITLVCLLTCYSHPDSFGV